MHKRRDDLTEAAIAAMAALIASQDPPDPQEAALIAVQYARALLEEISKE